MLACSTQPDLDKLNYPLYASFKLDGIRCTTPNDKVLSRTLKPIPNKFIQKELVAMPRVFDGELMVLGNFNELTSEIMSEAGTPDFLYLVFDLADMPANCTFERRYTELKSVVAELGAGLPRVILVHQTLCNNASEVRKLYDEAIKQGYEGLILRSLNGLYKEGRSTLKQEWMLKLKPIADTEATVVDFTELMHNENEAVENEVGAQARNKQQSGLVGGDTLGALVCKDKDGNIISIGSGFTASHRKIIWDNKAKYIGKLVTFKYQERTVDGSYRFPVFKTFREDL